MCRRLLAELGAERVEVVPQRDDLRGHARREQRDVGHREHHAGWIGFAEQHAGVLDDAIAIERAEPNGFVRALKAYPARHRVIHVFFAVGLRLVIRPLSVPAASSIMALMSVGLRERMAFSMALRNCSGVVACTPTPPNASISFS